MSYFLHVSTCELIYLQDIFLKLAWSHFHTVGAQKITNCDGTIEVLTTTKTTTAIISKHINRTKIDTYAQQKIQFKL